MSSSDRTQPRERLSLEKYFVNILDEVARRATCDRGRSGSLLVVQGQIIATGYVGSPPGFPHCDDVGHLMVNDHCVRTVHAEQNVLAQAAKLGHSTLGSTLYSTMAPCRVCAMLMVTAGIDTVVSVFGYPGDPDNVGPGILREAGVRYRQLSGALATYAYPADNGKHVYLGDKGEYGVCITRVDSSVSGMCGLPKTHPIHLRRSQ